MASNFKSNKAAVMAQFAANKAACLEALGSEYTANAKPEMRVDTGNMRERQTYESEPQNNQVIVGNEAPYAVHVHFPGITRNWQGDDWIVRTINNFESDAVRIARATLGEGFN